ncbi:retrovirus-related pol polyprotein from transposon TNT 1-94 [Tanacetum coccineum]
MAAVEVPQTLKYKVGQLNAAHVLEDFQDSPNDEEDTRSSHEYLNDLEEEYQERFLLANSKRFFKKGTQSSPQHKPKLRPTKDFEAKYNKVKAKLALLKEVSSDDNEMVEVKVLMALPEDNDVVSKEGARNGEWVKISMRKHVNTKILKENKNLRTELKELTVITKTWLNSSNKVNQCISEQIPSQKKRILGVDQLTEDPSSSGQKYLVFEKSLVDDIKVSIPGVERPWLFKAEGFILPNHDTGRILPAESQRNTIDPSVVVTDFSATNYDSADESLVCSTLLPPLKKLDGLIINEPSLALVKDNKSSSVSKVNSAHAGKLKSVKIEDDPPLAIVIKELNNLKLQFNKSQSSYSRSNQPLQVPQNTLQNKYKTQFKRSCHLCGLNNHLSENCYKVLFCKKGEKTDHGTCDHAEYISTMNMSQHLKILGRSSSRSKILRPSKRFFPPCTYCRCIDYLSNEYLYYPICGLCGSYDHDINGHNRIISLERDINPRNPQHAFKRFEVCGSSTHTTTDHYDIDWFKRGEALQAKKAKALKLTRVESSNANRSKTPTKRHMTGVKSYLHKYVEQPGPKVVFRDDSTCTTEGYGSIKCNGIVFTKVAFVDGLKYNLISISQLCDAKYIVQFDEKRGTIFNSNKEVIMIAPRVRDVYILDMTSSAQESCFFAKASENLNWLWHKRLAHLNFKQSTNWQNKILLLVFPHLSTQKINHVHHVKREIIIGPASKQNRHLLSRNISQNFSSPYTPEQNGVAERKKRTLIEAARTMLSGSVFSKQYWTEVVATARYTQNRSTIVKRHLKTPYEIFLNNIKIAKNKRYPPNEYLHPYEPSQRYQTNSNDVSFIDPYESPKPVVLETKVSSDQNGQTDQNDQTAQTDEILKDNLSEHSNHNNDEKIIDNLPNIEDIQISKHLSSPNVEDTSVQNTISIPNPPLPIPSVVTPAP